MFLQTFIVALSPLLLAVIAWYFVKSRKQLLEEEKLEISRIKMHDQKIAQEEMHLKDDLEESRLRGEMIVKLSEKIAQDLIIELEKALGGKSDTFKTIIPSGDNFEEKLLGISATIKNEYLNRIKKILSGLDSFEHQKAHNLIIYSEEQNDKTDQELKKIREIELSSIKEKIDRYKNEEIKLFDRKVKLIIDKAVIEVLGKALSRDDQEELIIKALETAKKDNEL